jgi:hypothetical protein
VSKLIERLDKQEAKYYSNNDIVLQYPNSLIGAYPKLRAVVLAANAYLGLNRHDTAVRLRDALAALEEDV